MIDEEKQGELESQDQEVTGSLASHKKVRAQNGRGFVWDSVTGRYTAK